MIFFIFFIVFIFILYFVEFIFIEVYILLVFVRVFGIDLISILLFFVYFF